MPLKTQPDVAVIGAEAWRTPTRRRWRPGLCCARRSGWREGRQGEAEAGVRGGRQFDPAAVKPKGTLVLALTNTGAFVHGDGQRQHRMLLHGMDAFSPLPALMARQWSIRGLCTFFFLVCLLDLFQRVRNGKTTRTLAPCWWKAALPTGGPAAAPKDVP